MTTATGVFNRTAQETHLWLHDLQAELDWDDEHRAHRALRAVLHALRDRLTVNEAAQLGSQLPALLRGFYYEGWRPAGKPLRERSRFEFLGHVEEALPPDERDVAGEVVRAVFRLLQKRISPGEVEDVKRMLPREVRELWE